MAVLIPPKYNTLDKALAAQLVKSWPEIKTVVNPEITLEAADESTRSQINLLFRIRCDDKSKWPTVLGSCRFEIGINNELWMDGQNKLIELAVHMIIFYARLNLNQACNENMVVELRKDGHMVPVASSFWLTADAISAFLGGMTGSVETGKFLVLESDIDRMFALGMSGLPKQVRTDRSEGAMPLMFPPYIDFMLKIARELGLQEEKRVVKAEIEELIKTQWPPTLKQSSGKVSAMATFLRRPEDERGGYFHASRASQKDSPRGKRQRKGRTV